MNEEQRQYIEMKLNPILEQLVEKVQAGLPRLLNFNAINRSGREGSQGGSECLISTPISSLRASNALAGMRYW